MVGASHYFGAVLLIAGTTIGAGMLALPIGTAFCGFGPALIAFFAIWIIMLISAYFFLDVNLSLPGETNFITMCEKTLGLWGKIVCWITYLLLLYSLTAAYIAGSAGLFQEVIAWAFGWDIPLQGAYFCLPILFGGFVYLGTVGVDVINRILMMGLAVSYLFLVGSLPEHVSVERLTHVDFTPFLFGILLLLTSFGYHIIIPSLTTYMHHDRKHLRRAIFIGSIIPLIVYIFWETLTLGIIPIDGKHSFAMAWREGVPITQILSYFVTSRFVQMSVHFFSFFAIVTSFLGVSLSLSDFLTDGFKIKATWEGRLIAIALTFIPPLLFLFTTERGFIYALQHAGAFVAILLIFLPAAMAWTLKENRFYASVQGKVLLSGMIVLALFFFCLDFVKDAGILDTLIENYVSVAQ